MTIAEIRAKLKTGRPTVGAWLQLPSPDVAEIIGRSGYDWAAVDMEHGAMTRGVLPDLFRALECGGTLPFVRVAEAGRENRLPPRRPPCYSCDSREKKNGSNTGS